MALNDILADVAKTLGLQDTELNTLNKACEGLEDSVRNNNDKLEQIKDEVNGLEAQLRVKKAAYDEAKYDGLKKIIKREIMSLFKTQDRILQDIDMIADKIDKDSMLRDQIRRLIFAIENPVRTELMGNTLIDMEMQIKELASEEKVSQDLEKTAFPASDSQPDIEERINAIGSTTADAGEDDEEFRKRLENIKD